MKTILALFISSIFFIHLNAQDSLRWNASRKLEWADFKGTPDTSSAIGSLAVCVLPYHYHKTDSSLKFTITCFFLRKSSWIRQPADSNGLAHAQGHFAIAELYTRITRQRLSGFQVSSKDWKQQMTTVINETVNEKNLMNERYDRETENGKNIPQQLLWSQMITGKLKETDLYAFGD